MKARALTRRLVDANRRYDAGDTEALGEIEEVMGELVRFYPVHIAKEDRHFFKPSMQYFSDAERAQMLAAFDEFDRMLIHEKYKGLVDRLEAGTG